MNYMEAAFAPAEAKYKQEVLADTWGHLAPLRNKTYRGHVVFAVGCFGSDDLNPTIIECELESRDGVSLDSSPWFYDSVTDFVGEFVGIDDSGEAKTGGVYRWEGTFRNYKWTGKLRRLTLS